MKLVRLVLVSIAVFATFTAFATFTVLHANTAGASVSAPGGIRAEKSSVHPTRPESADQGSCRSIRYSGSAGYIAVRTSSIGTVAWGIYMKAAVNRIGLWFVTVYVGERQVDHKVQAYEPHGSVPASLAKPGSIFSIRATMTNEHGDFESVPNGCLIP
jgi:hypothetical protein